MNEPSQARLRVTKAGGVAVALMVAAWIAGIAAGQFDSASWLGKLISAPFGVPVFISIVAAIFTGIGAVCGALGWPFFAKDHDA
jgi:hypothetical protein